MDIAGKKVKRMRLVRTDQFIVAVEVDAVIPDADPSEACFTSEVVELLRQVEQRAKAGDLAWLNRHGRVYAAVEAA